MATERVPSRSQAVAMVTRADLLAEEAAHIVKHRINWRGRLAELGDYGRAGGSAADRRAIVEGMAALEASTRG